MGLLVAILIVAALLAGFLWLVGVERKRGARVLGNARASLDRKVEGAVAYLASEHQGESLGKTIRVLLDHVVHDVAHGVLQAVRFVERTLTRITREIRGRRAAMKNEDVGGTSSVQ